MLESFFCGGAQAIRAMPFFDFLSLPSVSFDFSFSLNFKKIHFKKFLNYGKIYFSALFLFAMHAVAVLRQIRDTKIRI